jgi:cytosine/adenosine deaminase-related metal-dependent hydrolase
MRFLTADYLYPLHADPLKEGVLQITDKGEVVSIIEDRKSVPKLKLEVFKGILCPGFVNAHCHLELSHLQGTAKKGIGLLNFISNVQKRYHFDKDDILLEIQRAEDQMIKSGIVAVGDICNTSDTLFQKAKGNLQYYNFIEVFGVQDANVNQIISQAKDLRSQFRLSGLKSTISPHSPYSVTNKLAQEIARNFDDEDELFTIHIQETDHENELFKNKKGDFFIWLNSIYASPEIWKRRCKSTDILKELGDKKVLLVHNTFTTKEDLGSNYYCTCPKANLYIENMLPNYSIFNVEKLCVGTDSLASNNSLSILEELQVIRENSNFDLNELLKIASKNGAEALGFANLGTFEKGKKPGVNLIYQLSEIEIIA